jgi:predicted DNA-binding transcriptional regulator YafY
MYHPTTRVLTILELLQSYQRLSGSELAQRLEVNIRTVRHYITMLQDMGIPIEGERGRYGAYRLRPGFKLLVAASELHSEQPLVQVCGDTLRPRDSIRLPQYCLQRSGG